MFAGPRLVGGGAGEAKPEPELTATQRWGGSSLKFWAHLSASIS